MFGKKKHDGPPPGYSGAAPLDPELQELMDLEAAERGPVPMGGTPLDPELQEIMDLEEAERRAVPTGGPTVLDPELQELMDLEEAERRTATAAGPGASRMDQLQQLSELHAEGVLSDAEFEQEKARLLTEP